MDYRIEGMDTLKESTLKMRIGYLKSIWKKGYKWKLIKGSKWQPGILKVLENLGPEAQPMVTQLERIGRDYKQFDQSRISRDGETLPQQIAIAVQNWKSKQAGK